ncbi:hypothetical protein MSPP1_000569 [Malassezia sp. CBS 17886]|nr:hypothetical protein MSPP1_000569 [Malassezia sp. CBS 17886]
MLSSLSRTREFLMAKPWELPPPTSMMPGGICLEDADYEDCPGRAQPADVASANAPAPASADAFADPAAAVPLDDAPPDGAALPAAELAHPLGSPAKKRRSPPEVLIIVQPTPKKQQHHPYNVQIQLLSRGRTVSSTGSNAHSDSGHSDARSRSGSVNSLQRPDVLVRSMSTSSNRSGNSGISDVSTGSGSGAPRRSIPLYNLDFHHIRATTILDAGTDQQVARFTRRGVDISDVGVLQPHEVVQQTRAIPGTPATATGISTAPRAASSEALVPPTHSAALEHGAGPAPAAGTAKGATKDDEPESILRHKFFRRIKHLGNQFRANSDEHGVDSLRSRLTRSASTRSANQLRHTSSSATLPIDPTYANGTPPPSVPSVQQVVHAAIPQLVPGAGTAQGKITESYIWELKRLTRNDAATAEPVHGAADHAAERASADETSQQEMHNPLLARIWEQFNVNGRRGLPVRHPQPHTIHVYFEWVRDSSMGHGTTQHPLGSALHAAPGPLSSGSSAAVSPAGSPELAPMPDARISPEARTSQDAVWPPGRTGNAPPAPGEHRSASRTSSEISSEYAYSSWTCFLVLDKDTRIPLGHLDPAPHHPHLVCQIKLPSPLPDLRHSGLGSDARGFSREELRDIVVVTSVHLVVRESLGSLQNVAGKH